MNDLIRRQDAIDALDGIVVTGGRNSAVRMMRYIEAVRDRLKQLPSAPSEQKHGEWIKISDADGYYYCCSVCGEELPRYTTELSSWDKPYPHKHSIDKTDFCPNCGAKMDGKVKSK